MHKRVRTELWGYAADETLSNEELIRERYRGIRPAPGYPACPDHTEKGTLFTLLDATANCGVSLSESYAMGPASSVSGFYFSHPDARYYLGMSDTPPEMFVLMGPAAADPESKKQVEHDLTVATHADGILVSSEAAAIMAARARDLSVDPDTESVLLVAHGMGDDSENERVLAAMDAIAEEVRKGDFARVRTATLREDWEGPREIAEAEIREYVEAEAAEGRRVLVLPMRLSGFGPYAEVLDGLAYVPGDGLLPHAEMATWVRRTADLVSCGAGWGSVTGACPGASARPDGAAPKPEGY